MKIRWRDCTRCKNVEMDKSSLLPHQVIQNESDTEVKRENVSQNELYIFPVV